MFTVIVRNYFQPTRSGYNPEQWYSYGTFNSFAQASIWACRELSHLSDDSWYIAQHIPVEVK